MSYRAALGDTVRDVLRLLRGTSRERPFRIAAVALLTAAVVLVLAHVWCGHVEQRPAFWNDRFNLGRERGYGERLEYLMLLAAAGAFAVGAVRDRSRIHAVGALLLVALLLDNLFMGHERFGVLVQRLGGIDAEVGQIAAFAIVGLAGTMLLAWAFDRTLREHRVRVLAGLAMMFPVAAFGVGVDALQSLVPEGRMARMFVIVEDGGELMSIALLAATIIGIEATALLKWRAAIPMRRPHRSPIRT